VTNFHLWLDFESTGLNPRTDTILEAAWTVTDEDLVMRTPLRSRLCVIDPPATRRAKKGFAVGDRQNDNEGDWADPKKISQFVREMHEQSGLRDALEFSVSDPIESLRVLFTADDLARLIREDLAAVGYNRFSNRLILSGAGVSHFDNRVLNVHLPEMFPLEGNGSAGYAYWQHDVSTAKRALGPAWSALWSAAQKEPSGSPLYSWERPPRIGTEVFPHLTTSLDDGRLAFTLDAPILHRAADDVIAALVDGRVLRAAEHLFGAESQRSS
jgi:hypothetical protein